MLTVEQLDSYLRKIARRFIREPFVEDALVNFATHLNVHHSTLDLDETTPAQASEIASTFFEAYVTEHPELGFNLH